MYTEIKTIDQAIALQKDKIDLGKARNAVAFLPEKFRRGMIALLMLQVITDAVNNDDPAVEEFKPDYNNSDQEKWFPWYVGGDESGAGFRFSDSVNGWTNANARGGARLALRDEARADHMNEHFQDLYKEFYLILK